MTPSAVVNQGRTEGWRGVRIVGLSVPEHLAIDVRFEDSSHLRIRFDPQRLRGDRSRLLDVSEFCRAALAGGTVVWPCGYALDAEVARIKADEGSEWVPL